MNNKDNLQKQRVSFKENSMITKSDVLYRLKYYKKEFRIDSKKDKMRSSSYYKTLDDMMKKMIEKVEKTYLFTELEDWWTYSIDINSEGISLCLQKIQGLSFDKNGNIDTFAILEDFKLVTVESRMLTVDEYAKQYEVDQGTVRQWIRRGKLRAAVKHGNEWRIPELSEPTRRKYGFGQYKIKGHIDGLPEKYEFINNCEYVFFSQDEKYKKMYHISFPGSNYSEIICEATERERVELIIIASPDAICTSEGFGSFG